MSPMTTAYGPASTYLDEDPIDGPVTVTVVGEEYEGARRHPKDPFLWPPGYVPPHAREPGYAQCLATMPKVVAYEGYDGASADVAQWWDGEALVWRPCRPASA